MLVLVLHREAQQPPLPQPVPKLVAAEWPEATPLLLPCNGEWLTVVVQLLRTPLLQAKAELRVRDQAHVAPLEPFKPCDESQKTAVVQLP